MKSGQIKSKRTENKAIIRCSACQDTKFSMIETAYIKVKGWGENYEESMLKATCGCGNIMFFDPTMVEIIETDGD